MAFLIFMGLFSLFTGSSFVEKMLYYIFISCGRDTIVISPHPPFLAGTLLHSGTLSATSIDGFLGANFLVFGQKMMGSLIKNSKLMGS